jgi:hypothetical protein
MEYEELQRALAGNAQATQKLAGLDEDYSYAKELRGQPMPTPNQYGTVSPLQVLAGIVNNSRGRQQMRELGPQRQAARQEIAAGDAAVQGNALKMSMDKAAGEREARQQKMGANVGQGETWTDGKNDVAVVYNELNQPVDLAGNPVPEGFVPKERTYGLGSGGRGKAISYSDMKDFSTRATALGEVRGVVDDFKPEYAQPTNLPTGFVNDLAAGMSGQDLMKYVSKAQDQRSKEAMQWWARWRMSYTLPERDERFGATLTPNELRSWAEAENVRLGGDPNEILTRITKLRDVMDDETLNHLNDQMAGASTGRH